MGVIFSFILQAIGRRQPIIMIAAASGVAACTTLPESEVAQPVAIDTSVTTATAPLQNTITIEPAPDQSVILATIDAFFVALATGDADTLDRLISPDALSVVVDVEQPGQPVRYSKTRGLIDAISARTLPKIEEPYWDPIVLQRKTLAVVWTPYEVWVDEKLDHCGIDVFNLTRHDQQWKIDSIHWTDEPSACEELWPNGRSQLRPDMFSKGM